MSTLPAGRRPVEVAAVRAERATAETLESAAGRLIGASGGPLGKAAAQRFIANARSQGIDLSRFWFVRQARGKRVIAAALLAPSSGGTGMLFTSDPRNAEEARALGDAVDAACGSPEGVRLAQSLVEPEQAAIRRVVEGRGFRLVGNLQYLRRDWAALSAAGIETPWPEGVSVESCEGVSAADLKAALERTYIDTRDCPELCGLRRTEDVLASHRGSGVYRPGLWWLVRYRGTPEGVALINEFPEQKHAELVYLGLGPGLRGLGMSGPLLRHALRPLAKRRCRDVTCAVDERNAPALALYARHGFRAFARRVALVKPL